MSLILITDSILQRCPEFEAELIRNNLIDIYSCRCATSFVDL